MAFHTIQSALLGLLSTFAISTSALAAGSHAGGHADEATGYGKPGIAAKVDRSIQVDMSDNMRFTPADIAVKRGETVRFVIRNVGRLPHEFSLGTKQELEAHYEQMKKFPGMVHDEPNKISLAPGKQGEIIWQFTNSGAVDFACLHVGHYEAGMKGLVKVAR
ncbi:cupredoxin family protein [Pigmentiphaga aceris]|uniref:Cupredoxin family protein n=1 Tax=Pigmentiphaga aceris TaxID=1940612 RepID=A0A5C0AX89_9BURK|nr:cupredoxin family protein [Pigmentiphaga aceris]QEI05261.1 cupredoxin family protein [Pigmentiphaga aceris]